MTKCNYCDSVETNYCKLCKKWFCEKCKKKYGKRLVDMVKVAYNEVRD